MSRIKYTQLCYAERIVIENRLRNGESYNTIAKAIGRSESTNLAGGNGIRQRTD